VSWSSGFQLRVIEGRQRGQVIPLEEQTYVIGRASTPGEDAPGHLFFYDQTVSRIHAEVKWNDKKKLYYLHHKSKTNPTLVEGTPTDKKTARALVAGNRIQMGLLILEMEPMTVAAPKRATVEAPATVTPRNTRGLGGLGGLGGAPEPEPRRESVVGPILEALSSLTEQRGAPARPAARTSYEPPPSRSDSLNQRSGGLGKGGLGGAVLGSGGLGGGAGPGASGFGGGLGGSGFGGGAGLGAGSLGASREQSSRGLGGVGLGEGPPTVGTGGGLGPSRSFEPPSRIELPSAAPPSLSPPAPARAPNRTVWGESFAPKESPAAPSRESPSAPDSSSRFLERDFGSLDNAGQQELPQGFRLTVAEGPDRGKSFSVTETLMIIGKLAGGNDPRIGQGVLLSDQTLPREAALLIWQSRESTYGILEAEHNTASIVVRRVISGNRREVPVHGNDPLSLQDGDVIQIGETVLVLGRAQGSAQRQRPNQGSAPGVRLQSIGDATAQPGLEERPPIFPRASAVSPRRAESPSAEGSRSGPSGWGAPSERPDPSRASREGSTGEVPIEGRRASQEIRPSALRAQSEERSRGSQASSPSTERETTQMPWKPISREGSGASPAPRSERLEPPPRQPERFSPQPTPRDFDNGFERPQSSAFGARGEDRMIGSSEGRASSTEEHEVTQSAEQDDRMKWRRPVPRTPVRELNEGPQEVKRESPLHRSGQPNPLSSPSPNVFGQSGGFGSAQRGDNFGLPTQSPEPGSGEYSSGDQTTEGRYSSSEPGTVIPRGFPGATRLGPPARPPAPRPGDLDPSDLPTANMPAATPPSRTPSGGLSRPTALWGGGSTPPPASQDSAPPAGPVVRPISLVGGNRLTSAEAVSVRSNAPEPGFRPSPSPVAAAVAAPPPVAPVKPPPPRSSMNVDPRAIDNVALSWPWKNHQDFVLDFLTGPNKGCQIAWSARELQDDRLFKIGCSGARQNDIAIESPTITNQAATVRYRGGRFGLLNEGPDDSLLINRMPLKRGEQVVLMTGDRIDLGDTVVRFLERKIVEILQGYQIMVESGVDQDQDKHYPFSKQRLLIGRAKNCDVQLNDLEVSRVHVAVVYRDSKFFIQHRSETNPTFLNGVSLLQGGERLLQPGDRVRLSSLTLLQFVQNEPRPPS
jgi:pSer/pThr/pTyr-binding forkhead associated (FHA) protein